jgi:hypothetical protein
MRIAERNTMKNSILNINFLSAIILISIFITNFGCSGAPIKEPPQPINKKVDSKEVIELVDIYRQLIACQIQKNWAFSQSIAGGEQDLSAEIVFRVMPDGEIRDIWFDKISGNAYLDESARRAIMKTNPVSPHPEGLSKPFIPVGLRFTPEGIR